MIVPLCIMLLGKGLSNLSRIRGRAGELSMEGEGDVMEGWMGYDTWGWARYPKS